MDEAKDGLDVAKMDAYRKALGLATRGGLAARVR